MPAHLLRIGANCSSFDINGDKVADIQMSRRLSAAEFLNGKRMEI
jgi:hypothetical protein